jgi:isoleucyl-tRNA synthetase
VLAALVEGFAVCLAPLLPHLAEDIWQFVPYERTHASVFEVGWEGVARHDEPRSDADKALWAQVRALRVEVNRAFEVARSASLIGATLEAKLLLHVEEPALAAALKTWDTQSGNGVDELRFLFLASQVEPHSQPSP